jgi:hypothetical protein
VVEAIGVVVAGIMGGITKEKVAAVRQSGRGGPRSDASRLGRFKGQNSVACLAKVMGLVVVRKMGVMAEDMFAAGKAHGGVR